VTAPPSATPVLRTRLATHDDDEAIRAIYNLEVESSIVTFDLVPRSPEEQRRWLADRSGAHAVIVAESLGDGDADVATVVGFASLSPYRTRPAYSTSVENSVYVHRDHRGQGIGALLLHDLVDVARSHGFHAVFARIVGGHEASIALHRAQDFEVVGTEREVGRKFGRWLDVSVMQRLL
jgi:L-amino acid N-acyltransferase YncA